MKHIATLLVLLGLVVVGLGAQGEIRRAASSFTSFSEATTRMDVLDTTLAVTIARFDRSNGGLSLVSYPLQWGANVSSVDVALKRSAAGIIEANNGTAGTSAYIRPGTTAFAALGTPANGVLTYCTDCTIANPCASGDTGELPSASMVYGCVTNPRRRDGPDRDK